MGILMNQNFSLTAQEECPITVNADGQNWSWWSISNTSSFCPSSEESVTLS